MKYGSLVGVDGSLVILNPMQVVSITSEHKVEGEIPPLKPCAKGGIWFPSGTAPTHFCTVSMVGGAKYQVRGKISDVVSFLIGYSI